MIELCESIPECEAADSSWLVGFVGGGLFSPGTGAAVLEAGEIDEASETGLSKQCLL